MILKPIDLTTLRSVQQEKIQREGWLVRWDGFYIECRTPQPLPPLLKPKGNLSKGGEVKD